MATVTGISDVLHLLAGDNPVTATLPDKQIGPLPLTVQSAGPGHYIVQSALLNAPGDWELGLTLRVSEFDQFETKVEVPVR